MIRRLVPAVLAVAALTAGCGSRDEAPPLDPDKLTVYSAQHENLVRVMLEGFTEETGIELEFRDAQRLRAGQPDRRRRATRSPADVFLTENSPGDRRRRRGRAARAAGRRDAGAGRRRSTGRRRARGWASPPGPRCSSTTPSLVAEAELPASIMDLAEPAVAGASRDRAPAAPTSRPSSAPCSRSRARQATGAWLDRAEENAEVYQSNIAVMKAVNAGEIPTSASCTTTTGTATRPRPGDGSTTPSCTTSATRTRARSSASPARGVLASSDQPTDAQQLVAYLTSPAGQAALADEQRRWSTPSATAVASDPSPAAARRAWRPPTVDPGALNGPG